MKLLPVIIFILVISSLLLVSCEPEEIPAFLDQEDTLAMTNQEILEQFPDGLDEALEELELIE